jgi:hypothetical protein
MAECYDTRCPPRADPAELDAPILGKAQPAPLSARMVDPAAPRTAGGFFDAPRAAAGEMAHEFAGESRRAR